MFYKIIRALKESELVLDLQILELIEEETVNILKVKATLVDGSLLYITEVHTLEWQKYSYHWQDKDGTLRLRWDNSPHWPEIETHPHHLHKADKILPSPRVFIESVLTEIEKELRRIGSL